jgi:shikimate dehydrogenase
MITARTKLYGVIGDPVARSLSPVMQNGWLYDHGIDAVYVALRVGEAAALSQLGVLGFAGVNVTVPHKEAAFRLAASACPIATDLRAANVLRFDGAGVAAAFNTDADGFARSLEDRWPDLFQPTQPVLLIGAGGAARAVAYALAQRKQHVTIINRTASRAQALSVDLNRLDCTRSAIDYQDWSVLRDAMQNASLIINSMSDDSGIAWDFTDVSARCVDLRYGAMPSRFLAAARRVQCETCDGLGMLIHQGALTFEHWFGATPDLAKAHARLLTVLA